MPILHHLAPHKALCRKIWQPQRLTDYGELSDKSQERARAPEVKGPKIANSTAFVGAGRVLRRLSNSKTDKAIRYHSDINRPIDKQHYKTVSTANHRQQVFSVANWQAHQLNFNSKGITHSGGYSSQPAISSDSHLSRPYRLLEREMSLRQESINGKQSTKEK